MGERRLCYGCMTLVELKGGICPFCGYNNNQPSKDPNCLTPGTILRDRYLIGVPCSMNGEGISYLAYDHSVGCRVIVREYMPRHLCSRVEGNPAIRISSAHLAQYKTLMADFTELHRELARLRGQIQINDVTDLFSDYNTTYVVMEFPEGVRLVDYLKQNAGELTWSHLSTMLPRFLTTLSILHNAGIVHRAISPETIYITESETMMITGFGIASVRTANTELECQIYGGYAAPEQYSANNRQGTWTDVYAVCAVIYRILTGCMPTTAISRMENDNLVAPGLLNPNVPEQVSLTVMAGLRIPSNDRIQTITELVTSLFHPSRIRSNGQQNQNRYMQTTSYSTSSMQNASPQADPNYDPYYDPSDYQRTDNGYADDYSYDSYENDGNYEAEPPSAVDRLKLPIIVGIILLIVLLLVLYSCKSIALYDTSTDYDFKFDLYSQVKMYFRANLKYPTVNELWNYCWKITNEVNDDTFLSFDDFDKAAYKNVSGREEFLQHLSLYKKEISFQFKKGAMFVFWKNKNGLKLSLI